MSRGSIAVLAAVVAFVIGVGAGAGLVAWLGPSSSGDPVIVEVEREVEAECPAPGEGERDCREALEALEARVARDGEREGAEEGGDGALVDHLESLLVKSGGASEDGVPMGFPDWLPGTHTPEGFAAALEVIRRECPDVIPPSAKADCSEFPCIVVALEPKAPNWTRFKSCGAWSRRFGDNMGLQLKRMTPPGHDPKFVWTMQPDPHPSEGQLREHMGAFAGNLRKRSEARRDDLFIERASDYNVEACEAGEMPACFQLGSMYKGRAPEESIGYFKQGCEGGHGGSCVAAARIACIERGECSDELVEIARKGVEINPKDGPGALNTLGTILCQRGDVAGAVAAFQRSCQSGYKQNCGRACP